MCDQIAVNDNWHNCKGFVPDSILNNLQIFEIKQLADKEALYRIECRAAIRNLKAWRQSQADQTDMIEMLYGAMEGEMLHDLARKKTQLYWKIRQHFKKAFDIYLKNTGVYKKPTKIAA